MGQLRTGNKRQKRTMEATARRLKDTAVAVVAPARPDTAKAG